jgi:hypothetical protein
MSMHDIFAIGEGGAQAVSDWLKAAAIAIGIGCGLAFVLDLSDGLSNSTPAFVASQWMRHAAGRFGEGEKEARALLEQAARETGLERLSSVRVWASDRLTESEANGMFNPLVYKITLGERFAQAADYDQRWVVFHEAGHAAQLLTTRFEPIALPSWGLSEKTARAMSGSLLYRQAYSESFADVFALAMALRLDAQDPRAISELASAQRGQIDSVSISHDTQAALRLAARILPELATAKGQSLLSLIDAIASKGAAQTIGEWGAEREALCLEGFWGWERWARDGAHEIASNPWTMASSEPVDVAEPRSQELSELMGLTRGPNWGYKREAAMKGSWGAYRERVEGAVSLTGAQRSREQAWGAALADYERASRNWARAMLAPPLRLAARLSEQPRPSGCLAP